MLELFLNNSDLSRFQSWFDSILWANWWGIVLYGLIITMFAIIKSKLGNIHCFTKNGCLFWACTIIEWKVLRFVTFDDFWLLLLLTFWWHFFQNWVRILFSSINLIFFILFYIMKRNIFLTRLHIILFNLKLNNYNRFSNLTL